MQPQTAERDLHPVIEQRWQIWRDNVLRPLRLLYGERDDFEFWIDCFLDIVNRSYLNRADDLRALDEQRLFDADWYQQSDQIGYIAYVDRFAGTLQGVIEKIPYLKELGVTYLHLMPLLQAREGENDGGYAVTDYRKVDPALGSIDDLRALTAALRANNISLCTDLVCNHTAVEHSWARKAAAGQAHYRDYYFIFPDRTLPDQYDRTLREIFPAFKRGNFVYHEDVGGWVWTTFSLYQWDLNYRNPQVFAEMLEIILYLANCGVEIIRMDAVAFLWKEMGTACENLPGAHRLLQAWRALSRLAAPGTLLKAEAIVSPEMVVPYFGAGKAASKECELAYHNTLMVYLWSSLAERKVNVMTYGLQQLPQLPDDCGWVTYVRCHDDIGWAITDYNAEGVGLSGWEHRRFLSDFYSGAFEGSFARGLVFQFNPVNYDRRISGATASLAGLEAAVEQRNVQMMELAIARILLIHSVILVIGGIPLIYMGDELGLLNDYSFYDDSDRAKDNRWVHRPRMDWRFAKTRHDRGTIPNRLFNGLRHMIFQRKEIDALHAGAASTPVWTYNDAVFGVLRYSPRGHLLALANFSEQMQHVDGGRLTELGFGGALLDRLGQQPLMGGHGIWLQPYQPLWLETVTHGDGL